MTVFQFELLSTSVSNRGDLQGKMMRFHFGCFEFEMPLNHLSGVVFEAAGHRGLQEGLDWSQPLDDN